MDALPKRGPLTREEVPGLLRRWQAEQDETAMIEIVAAQARMIKARSTKAAKKSPGYRDDFVAAGVLAAVETASLPSVEHIEQLVGGTRDRHNAAITELVAQTRSGGMVKRQRLREYEIKRSTGATRMSVKTVAAIYRAVGVVSLDVIESSFGRDDIEVVTRPLDSTAANGLAFEYEQLDAAMQTLDDLQRITLWYWSGQFDGRIWGDRRIAERLGVATRAVARARKEGLAKLGSLMCSDLHETVM